MTRYAQIDRNGRALVFLDGHPDDWPDLRDAGVLIAASGEIEPGWVWNGTEFTPPVDASNPVPEVVTNFQCRAMLMAIGLFDTVDAMVKLQGGVAFQAWEYANTVSRNGPLVMQIAGALGFTPEAIDDLFRQAALIEA